MKYIILVGLPASGKTTWANSYYDYDIKSKREVRIIACDEYLKQKRYQSLEEFISKNKKGIIKCNPSVKEVIIDGLFTTNESVIKLINVLEPTAKDSIEIIQWNENREQCIINDIGRRESNSTIDIMNITYEDININLIKQKTNHTRIEKQTMDVYEKDEEVVFIESKGIDVDEDGKFYSKKWIVGGSWGDCWGNTSPVTKTEPEDFDEFDSLLEEICPNITYLQYKKIKKRCVTLESLKEVGYYGSSTEYNYYECNVYRLYDILKELSLLY